MKRKASPVVPDAADLTMDSLVEAISQTHRHFSIQAGKAVNVALTMRNWMIGAYLREFEQHGQDRARYGEQLMNMVAARLSATDIGSISARTLRLYRQLYLTYPQIWQSSIANSEIHPSWIWQSAIAKLPTPIVEPLTPQSLSISGRQILESLSFTHLAELLQIDDAEKRAFYETECISGTWSVRELKRQVASLYYERSALSTDKAKLSAQTHAAAVPSAPTFPIRDPYIFEFLGLKPMEVMGESHLEDQLLDHLQTFLLELGHGFCFEARQKRILIGETHGFVDLVFYHRVLKCHVLVELKLQAFSHEAAGQLNTYVTWYARHMMSEGDNPPVGILLCSQKDHTLAEYALAGMDNQLFVSRYQLELPSKEILQRFLEQQLKEA
jgi:predicted nuclease of restriction endonuclease-like (RecB) superfamily